MSFNNEVHLARSKSGSRVPTVAQWFKNPTAVSQIIVEVQVWSPAWLSGLKDVAPAMTCIQSLTWELPYAEGKALKNKKINKR